MKSCQSRQKCALGRSAVTNVMTPTETSDISGYLDTSGHAIRSDRTGNCTSRSAGHARRTGRPCPYGASRSRPADQAIVADFRTSGLTVQAYCDGHRTLQSAMSRQFGLVRDTSRAAGAFCPSGSSVLQAPRMGRCHGRRARVESDDACSHTEQRYLPNCFRIFCSSSRRSRLGCGYAIFRLSNLSMRIWETISRAFCLSSAGTEYHGALAVLVADKHSA